MVLNKPANRFYNDKTVAGPFFQIDKDNNLFAFTSMYNMFKYEDDKNEWDETLTKTIKDGKIPANPGQEVPSNEAIGRRLANLGRNWDKFQNSEMYEDVREIITNFFGTWNKKDNMKLLAYRTESEPLFMNVSHLIDLIIDEKGNIKPYTAQLKQDVSDYANLARDWRLELTAVVKEQSKDLKIDY